VKTGIQNEGKTGFLLEFIPVKTGAGMIISGSV
jgi:hypothetical protein